MEGKEAINEEICHEKSTASSLPTNEVYSLIPYDAQKPTLVFSVSDGLDWTKFKVDMQAAFPEVNIVLRHGMTTEGSVMADTADIYLPLAATLRSEDEAYLMDLSSFESSNNYYTTALESCASINDDKQYLLPMASNIRGIVYNKTLFEENGWTVPQSKTEFIELCHTIDASGVVKRAFQPTFKFSAGVYNFAEFYQMSNMFDSLDYFSTMNPGTRSAMMYETRSAAMTDETQNASLYATQFGSNDEFAMMPYWGGDNPGDDYIMANPIAYLGVNKKVGEKGNEEKMKLVTEVLNYIATKEGQEAFIPEGNIAVTQLKNAETDYGNNAMLKNVSETIKDGRMVPARPIYNTGIKVSQNAIDDVINGMLYTERHNTNIIKEDRAVTYEEAVAYLDGINQNVIDHSESTVQEVYGTAKKPFTVLETTEYLAQMLKDKGETDIGLFLSNTLSRGNNTAIPQGDLVKKTGGVQDYDFIQSVDSSQRGNPKDENDQKMATVTMTGDQILKALEAPANSQDTAMFEPFFVAAGLKIEFAPWANKGSRYLKVTLSDGSELKADEEYTVAFWNNTINTAYLTNPVKVYDDTFADILKAQLKKDGTIAPFNDGRFKLNWDVVGDATE